MSAETVHYEDENGDVQSETMDVDYAAQKAAMKRVMPIIKQHGEAIGGAIQDAMEQSMEKLIKKVEQGKVLGRDDDEPDYDKAGGQPHSMVGSEVVDADERRQISDLYFKSLGRKAGQGDHTRAQQWVDHNVEDKRLKHLTKGALEASNYAELGIMIPEVMRDRVRELRDNAVVVRQMAPTPVRLRAGALQVPVETARAQAFWTGESENLTITDFSRAREQLTLKKLTVLIVASNELLRDGTNVSAVIERQMERAFRLKEDESFLLGDGTGNTPLGLENMIDSGNKFVRTQDGGSITVQTITNDLIKCQTLLREANHSVTNGAYVINGTIWGALMSYLSTDYAMSPFMAEIRDGRLMGQALFETNTIPNDRDGDESQVHFYLRDYITIYDSDGFAMDASRDASYKDADGNLQSCFSLDQTVWRLIGRTEIGYEYSDGAAQITGINDW